MCNANDTGLLQATKHKVHLYKPIRGKKNPSVASFVFVAARSCYSSAEAGRVLPPVRGRTLQQLSFLLDALQGTLLGSVQFSDRCAERFL